MEVDISAKKALSKTLIEIDREFMQKLYETMAEDLRENVQFVPPLFDEFTIKIIAKDVIRNEIFFFCKQKNDNFLFLTQQEQDGIIEKVKKASNITRDDSEELIYVKYITATKFVIIYFEGMENKKGFLTECEYEADNSKDEESYYSLKTKSFSGMKIEKAELELLAQGMFINVLAVSEYMQKYNENIEYSEIKVGELKKSDKSKKNHNKGYSQTIKLKSKVKKYILNSENDKEKRKCQYHKKCWYVRGYYQRFGSDKIIKYVPPRVNYRKGVSTSVKPKPGKYEIVDSDKCMFISEEMLKTLSKSKIEFEAKKAPNGQYIIKYESADEQRVKKLITEEQKQNKHIKR